MDVVILDLFMYHLEDIFFYIKSMIFVNIEVLIQGVKFPN